MLDFFILASLVVIAFAVSFFVLRAKIRKELSKERFLDEIADEVARLVMELNQSADRNINLLETRVEELKALLDRADKGIVALRRELEALPARPEQGGRREAAARERQASQPSLPGIDAPRAPDAARGGEAEGRIAQSGAANEPRPARRAYGASAYEAAAGTSVLGSEGQARHKTYIELKPDPKDEALAMSKAGLSPEAIAKRIGKTVGEVELMIALGERSSGGS
jgi:hypothetical protein